MCDSVSLCVCVLAWLVSALGHRDVYICNEQSRWVWWHVCIHWLCAECVRGCVREQWGLSSACKPTREMCLNSFRKCTWSHEPCAVWCLEFVCVKMLNLDVALKCDLYLRICVAINEDGEPLNSRATASLIWIGSIPDLNRRHFWFE